MGVVGKGGGSNLKILLNLRHLPISRIQTFHIETKLHLLGVFSVSEKSPDLESDSFPTSSIRHIRYANRIIHVDLSYDFPIITPQLY